MGKVVDFKKPSKTSSESKETELDELFDDIIERNKEVKERLAEKRKRDNEKVKRSYKLKGKEDK